MGRGQDSSLAGRIDRNSPLREEDAIISKNRILAAGIAHHLDNFKSLAGNGGIASVLGDFRGARGELVPDEGPTTLTQSGRLLECDHAIELDPFGSYVLRLIIPVCCPCHDGVNPALCRIEGLARRSRTFGGGIDEGEVILLLTDLE